jgi:hypothetical protein
MVVDRDYFDGDSHYGFRDVEKEAKELGAVAWRGNVESNSITIEYSEV